MQSMLKTIKLLSDPSRLRMLLLLEREELSVAELQAILSMGQSSISTHLSQLRQAGLVEDRRTGKNVLYRLPEPGPGWTVSEGYWNSPARRRLRFPRRLRMKRR